MRTEKAAHARRRPLAAGRLRAACCGWLIVLGAALQGPGSVLLRVLCGLAAVLLAAGCAGLAEAMDSAPGRHGHKNGPRRVEPERTAGENKTLHDV